MYKSKYKSTNKSKYNEFSLANIIMMIDIFRMNKKQLDKVKQLWVRYLILIKKKVPRFKWCICSDGSIGGIFVCSTLPGAYNT
jgi:hypothetical protein